MSDYCPVKMRGNAGYGRFNGQEPIPLAASNNASRVIKYVSIFGIRYASYGMVELRVHDINVVADLTRHDPTAPDPDESVVNDGTPFGIAESTKGKTFAAQYEDIAANALTLVWLAPWPALEFTCNLIFEGLEFYLVFTVDILGSLTPGSCRFVHPVLEALTTEDQEEVITKTMELSTIQTLNAIILTSSIAAMFFATFQLLPSAQAAYTIAMITWTASTMLLIYTLAEYYLNGLSTSIEAGFSLFVLMIGIILAGTQISEESLLVKAFSFLDKYRGDSLPEWGYHTTFYWCAGVGLLIWSHLNGINTEYQTDTSKT